jgi:hypothetical protein
LLFTSAATPTAKWRLQVPDTAMGLSSLDKPDWLQVCGLTT